MRRKERRDKETCFLFAASGDLLIGALPWHPLIVYVARTERQSGNTEDTEKGTETTEKMPRANDTCVSNLRHFRSQGLKSRAPRTEVRG